MAEGAVDCLSMSGTTCKVMKHEIRKSSTKDCPIYFYIHALQTYSITARNRSVLSINQNDNTGLVAISKSDEIKYLQMLKR